MKYERIRPIRVIFWDFDGVIMNSNGIRDRGFTEVLKAYPAAEVDRLLAFHRQNGGLSRYVKFRYFFEQIRGESITEEQLKQLASEFSVIMRRLLTDPDLLINETVDFIREKYRDFEMHIVSGSDQEELRFLCREHGIDTYFKSIHGSPVPKTEWVKRILQREGYKLSDCMLIGDSINDYDAAADNGIDFMAYNNPGLRTKTTLEIALH